VSVVALKRAEVCADDWSTTDPICQVSRTISDGDVLNESWEGEETLVDLGEGWPEEWFEFFTNRVDKPGKLRCRVGLSLDKGS
jgi:hypothetical protein